MLTRLKLNALLAMSKPFSYVLILLTTSLTAHAQTCKTNSISATTPNSRFEIISGGSEAKDTITGLIWQRCSVGQTWNGTTCIGTATTHSWQQALRVVKNLGNGYRLPNIKELKSIVERQCYDPAINQTIFPNTQNSYWSASPDAYDGGYVWRVYFGNGGGVDDGNGYKNDSHYVRAVRSN